MTPVSGSTDPNESTDTTNDSSDYTFWKRHLHDRVWSIGKDKKRQILLTAACLAVKKPTYKVKQSVEGTLESEVGVLQDFNPTWLITNWLRGFAKLKTNPKIQNKLG